jgi:predicted metal-binding membrane protein
VAAARRDRLITCLCVLLLAALSWAYLVHLSRQMTDAMDMAAMGMAMDAPWTWVDVFLTFVMWAVMMVGMMAPSAMPVLLLYGSAMANRADAGARGSVLLFGLGYFLVWTAFSAGAALAQAALHQLALLSPAMRTSSPLLGGGLLVGAGLYQLTPLKGACLTACRSPIGFLMSNWREGRTGALQMGVRHGVHCLGCCWALMSVLFALGVMNLGWVAAIAILVLVEKATPFGAVIARVAGGVLIVAGVIVAFARA